MDPARPQENYPPLRRNPLLYVIAVVDIVPLRNLESYIPKIQDALRLSGYPFNSENAINELTIGPNGVQTRLVKQWQFLNRDKTYGVSVSEGKIAVETTAYTVFSDFQSHIERVLSAFTLIGGEIIARQFGLRYINALQPAEGETFDALFQERLAGVSDNFAGVKDASFNVAFQGRSDRGLLTIRVHQPPLALPEDSPRPLLAPDLSTTLEVSRKVDPTRKYRVLDLDHVAVEEKDFSIPHIVEILNGLHDTLDEAFRNSVSREAYQNWAAE